MFFEPSKQFDLTGHIARLAFQNRFGEPVFRNPPRQIGRVWSFLSEAHKFPAHAAPNMASTMSLS
jgi:hypothetical protein